LRSAWRRAAHSLGVQAIDLPHGAACSPKV
jgi:hypothetical protein